MGLGQRSTRVRVTASDVAASAGVAVSTVSKALTGNGAVRHETRQRILEAARQLGYRADGVYPQSTGGRTGVIGVITSDQFGRFTVPILLGANEILAEKNMAMLLYDGRGDPIREQHFIDLLIGHRVDGILMAGAGAFSRESVGRSSELPVVYALSWSRSESDFSVTVDDDGGERQATRHMLSTGRTRLVYIGGQQNDDASHIRLAATTEVLAENGLHLVGEPLFGEWTERWGRQAILQMLKAGREFDGVVCASDQIARGAVDGMRENGIDVPHEVGVIGFDNWDVIVEGSRPQLSTIDMNLLEVGSTAATALLRAIDSGEPLAHGGTRIGCYLVPRESTAVG